MEQLGIHPETLAPFVAPTGATAGVGAPLLVPVGAMAPATIDPPLDLAGDSGLVLVLVLGLVIVTVVVALVGEVTDMELVLEKTVGVNPAAVNLVRKPGMVDDAPPA